MERPDLIKYYNSLGFKSDIDYDMVVVKWNDITIGEMNIKWCEVDDILEYYKEYEPGDRMRIEMSNYGRYY